ncbi:MAG: DUF3500 domain-containing protein [Chloroflexi bacterium]|nr:DUF3500 domain-containing protein [Chloroflexota bacterium]
MTTTAPYYGLGLRGRPPVSARRPAPDVGERFGRMRDNGERLVQEPFKGITTDGNVVPDLFPLAKTGVSTEPIRRAALDFLDALDANQRQQARFDLTSDAWRRWWNIHPFLMRHGVQLEELNDQQRASALRLVESTLSASGARTARDIMRLNYTIGEITGSWTEYGEWIYFVSIFGEPAADQPWGWQIDGHHLIVNCFVIDDQVVITPVFMGSEPVVAETGIYKGTSILQTEQNEGLAFINALNAEQRGKAILYDSILSTVLPPERGIGSDGRVQTAAFRDNMQIPYEGIRCDALTAGQREQLVRLAALYTNKLRAGHAELWLNSVRRYLDDTHFMWMGGIGLEDVFYYRIHSPVILIEFDHQPGIAFDSDEPTRAHIHTVIRTPNGNDYGMDYLRQHHARYRHVNGQHVLKS